MHGRGRRLVPRALALLAVLAVLPWASSALGDSGPNPPEATTEQAHEVTKTTARLTGTVNPKGRAVTSCEFKYGTSPEALSSSAECSPKPGSGSAPEAVVAEVAALTPNTTYYFQVVATGEEGTGEGSKVSFKTTPNAPVATAGAAREVKLASAVLVGTVNPEGATVTCEFEYGTNAASLEHTTPCVAGAGEEVTAAVTHLTPGTPYFFRVVASGEGGKDESSTEQFTTLADELAVGSVEASPVTKYTATLKAMVTPGGAPVTSCKFEYGTTKGSPTSSVPCVEPLPVAGPGSGEVSAEATGLAPNTTYYFKLVADNEAEVPRESAEGQFTTSRNPPAVVTGGAGSVSQTAVTIAGTVTPPEGEAATCAVEYGTEEALGSSVPCPSSIEPGTTPVKVEVQLTGLAPGTTYYYRVVAKSPGGEEVGKRATFATLVVTPVPTPTPTTTTTTPPGGTTTKPKGPEPARPPVVSSLNESNTVFRVGRSSTAPGGRISRVSPTGTVFSFVLDQPAVVGVVFVHEESGHRIGKSCVVGRRGRGKPACVRSSVAMTLGRRARYGLNKLPFTGRVRGKALRPGAYKATFTAESLAGGSTPVTIAFRVVAH